MTRLLHISASPRSEASESLALADAYLAAVADRPDVDVEHWDLWDGSLPGFGPDAAAAKMAVFDGAEPTGAAAAAWERAIAAFRRLDAADAYLLSVPMWNGSIPYVLKQLIDVVSQPGMLFGFDAAVRVLRAAHRQEGGPRSHERGLWPGPAGTLRHRLPTALPRVVAGLGRHRGRHDDRIPAQPRHGPGRPAPGRRPRRGPRGGPQALTGAFCTLDEEWAVFLAALDEECGPSRASSVQSASEVAVAGEARLQPCGRLLADEDGQLVLDRLAHPLAELAQAPRPHRGARRRCGRRCHRRAGPAT